MRAEEIALRFGVANVVGFALFVESRRVGIEVLLVVVVPVLLDDDDWLLNFMLLRNPAGRVEPFRSTRWTLGAPAPEVTMSRIAIYSRVSISDQHPEAQVAQLREGSPPGGHERGERKRAGGLHNAWFGRNMRRSCIA